MEPILSIGCLSKAFGRNIVLKDISLNLNPGDIMGLVGKSGCGKSTLLKILVGYYRADAGKIIFKEKNITQDFGAIKRLVGYTTQDNAFYDKLTVYENMEYYARLYGLDTRDIKQYILNLLNSVGLLTAKDMLAENISGGMKRRLDFAISIVHDPELIILDEPTAGLDPLLVDQFWKVVYSVAKKGKKAVLVTSHILSEIQTHCNKAAIMDNGKIENVLDLTKSGMDLNKKFREMLS